MRFLPLVLVVLLAGCVGAPNLENARPAGSAPSPSVEPDYSALPAEFGGNATVTAGVDVQPGTYLVEAEQPNCEWFKGVDGDLVASGRNDLVLLDGETVEVYGCAVFVKAD